jgi:hypothetical protein
LPAPENAGTGDGAPNRKGTQLDLGVIQGIQYHEEMPLRAPSPSWQPYFDFLIFLSKQGWLASLAFVPLDVRQVKPHYSYLPVFADEDGVILNSSTNLHLESDARAFRGPRVSVATIGANSGLLVLMSFEPANPSSDSAFRFYAISVSANFLCLLDNIHQIIGARLRSDGRCAFGVVHEIWGDADSRQAVADKLHTYFGRS